MILKIVTYRQTNHGLLELLSWLKIPFSNSSMGHNKVCKIPLRIYWRHIGVISNLQIVICQILNYIRCKSVEHLEIWRGLWNTISVHLYSALYSALYTVHGQSLETFGLNLNVGDKSIRLFTKGCYCLQWVWKVYMVFVSCYAHYWISILSVGKYSIVYFLFTELQKKWSVFSINVLFDATTSLVVAPSVSQ